MSLSRLRPAFRLLRPPTAPIRTIPHNAQFRLLRTLHSPPHGTRFPLHPTTLSTLRSLPAHQLRLLLHPQSRTVITLTKETKAYIKEQAYIFFQTVFYGYAFIFLGVWAFWGLRQVYLEDKQATPEPFDFWNRVLIRHARSHADLSMEFNSAAAMCEEAVKREFERVEKGEQKSTEEWKKGMVETAWEWLMYEERGINKLGQRKALQSLLGMEWVKGAERAKAELNLASVMEEMGDDDEEVEEHLVKALNAAGEEVGKTEEDFKKTAKLGVIPAGSEMTNALLEASTELGIYHARRGNLSAAMPIFISVLRARDNTSFSDPCEEGMVSSYIGELLFASGRQKEGLDWNEKALELTVPMAELRKKCKDCAVYTTRNLMTMFEILGDDKKAEEASWKLMKLEAIRVSRYD